MNLRRWFLFPSWLWMAALFATPLAIVLAYSFLTRGVYGGIEQPWTVESYQRLFDPLYLSIYLRSIVMAIASTGFCLVLGFPAALFIASSPQQESLLATRHASLLDQFLGPNVCLALSAPRYRAYQQRVTGTGNH